MATTTRLEQAALILAERGYKVFPVRARAKTPITGDGFKSGTRDDKAILHWWDRHPDANIGIACQATGIVVLDIDSKHGADPSSVLEGRDLDGAPVILTGEAPPRDRQHPHSLEGVRGAQVYFRGHLPTGPLQDLEGCEIRGDGAYVVAPPSVHPCGVTYDGELPAVDQLPEPPAWLLEHAQAAGRSSNGPAPVVEGKIAKGEQHRTLVSMAGTMRRRGMTADEIEAALLVTNRTRLEDPAPPDHIRKIAESIARYAPGDVTTNGHMPGPPAPSTSARQAMLQLGELLDLPEVGLQIDAARIYGRGSSASLEIDVSNGETLTFSTLREMMRPQTLIAEVAACTGATPSLKQPMCARALTLARLAAEYVEIDTENDIAREWGRDFLQLAETFDIDINDQAERWGAFEALAEREGWGLRGEQTGHPLVLRDRNGVRYVRTVWFERYVKSRDGSVARTSIGGRMARVGWSKRGERGTIKATAPGRPDTKTFPFWIVPNGWGDTP